MNGKKIIVYGRFSCVESTMKGTLEEVYKKYPNIDKRLLKGAHSQVKQVKKDDKKKS